MVSKKHDLKKEAEASVALSESAPEPEQAQNTSPDVDDQAPEPVPRPVSPFSKALGELREAFPDADESVQRAVLVAAGGKLERAFNGMLALSDDTIRPSPPTPIAKDAQSQIARDEELARQLARDYRPRQRRGPRNDSEQSLQDNYNRGPRQYSDMEHDNDSWDNFQESVRQGWTETTKKMSSLFGQLRERIQNEINDDDLIDDNESDLYGVPDRRRSSGRPPRDRRAYNQYNDAEAASEPPPPPPRPNARANKPVNAFGEERASRWQPLQASETSDAFFIGESDSDLESLTGDEPKDKPKTDNSEAETTKESKESKESKAEEAEEAEEADESKDSKDSNEPTEEDKPKSKAKEMLKQVKEKADS